MPNSRRRRPILHGLRTYGMTSRVASYGARFAGVVFRREAECQDLPHRARRRRGAGRRPAWRNRWLRRHRPACDVVIGVLRRMEYRGGATTVVIAEEADGTVRPYTDYLIEIPAVSMLSNRCSRRFFCRFSLRHSRRLKATTLTSRVTSPGLSPSNNPGHRGRVFDSVMRAFLMTHSVAHCRRRAYPAYSSSQMSFCRHSRSTLRCRSTPTRRSRRARSGRISWTSSKIQLGLGAGRDPMDKRELR
jgi:hypothetical protein